MHLICRRIFYGEEHLIYVQKLCGLVLFHGQGIHYSRSASWLALIVGVPYALASVSRICALYYGK